MSFHKKETEKIELVARPGNSPSNLLHYMQLYLPLGRGPGLFQGVKTGLLLPKAGLVFGGLVVFVPGIQGSSGFQQDFQSGQFTVADPK